MRSSSWNTGSIQYTDTVYPSGFHLGVLSVSHEKMKHTMQAVRDHIDSTGVTEHEDNATDNETVGTKSFQDKIEQV